MRFTDLLKATVLICAGAASALAAVALYAADRDANTTLAFLAAGWWAVTALYGVWAGRREQTSPPIAVLLAAAKTSPALPELHPGRMLLNRLWPLLVMTVLGGALAFLFPQVPAIAAGFLLAFSLRLRRQEAAVAAIEERDGVRFYVERVSPFKPTRLLRTPGFRKNEPAPTDVQRTSA
jgi:hypothetical protein